MTDLPSQIRQAARNLLRSPAYMLVAVLTLAVGIGAVTVVFSLISAALLRPLSYPGADRAITIEETRDDQPISVSWLDLLDFRERSRTLESVAGYYSSSFNLTGTGDAERLTGGVVTANLFRTLGVAPALGRDFLSDEDRPGAARTVALSHPLWVRRFGADPAIVGRRILLDGEPHDVVAVMPDGFRFPEVTAADLYVPMSELDSITRGDRGSHPGIIGIGILKPGQTVESARADLAGVAAQLVAENPVTNARQSVRVRSVLEAVVGTTRPGLLLVLGAVALVLVIACINVAGLVIARSTSRQRDVAIRVALGAARGRIAREMFIENALLGAIGGVAGFLLALGSLAAVRKLVAVLPRMGAITLDWRVLGGVAAATIGATLLFGMAPALWAGRIDPDRWLRARGGGADPIATRARRVLVAGEIALSLMLLATSGLLLQSFANMRTERGGLDPTGVLTFVVGLPQSTYTDADRITGFYTTLEQRLGGLPGVQAVGGISVLPFSGFGAQSGIRRASDPPGPDSERRTDVAVATPGYFDAMGLELRRGRLFTEADRSGTTPTIVVDETLAQFFWPGQDPIGQRLAGWGFQSLEVVGVIAHVKNYGIAADSRQELFVPHRMRPAARLTMAVRTSGDPAALIGPARAIVSSLDPDVPIYQARAMTDVVAATQNGPRLAAVVSAAFAMIALVLTAIGLYGLIAFWVSQRTREIGVRMALGAARERVTWMVVRQALTLAGVGCVIGLTGSVLIARLIRTSLFGLSPTDPATLGAGAAALVGVALLASWIPARRAARIPPTVALRAE